MADLVCPACGAHLEVRRAAESDRERWAEVGLAAMLREADSGPPDAEAPE